MKERWRAASIALSIVALLATTGYVAGEGAWYAASGNHYFGPGTVYRKVYAPLDAVSDRVPGIYDARQSLANGWLRASGEEPNAMVHPLAIYLCR